MELGGAAGRAHPGPRQLDLTAFILQKWRLGSGAFHQLLRHTSTSEVILLPFLGRLAVHISAARPRAHRSPSATTPIRMRA